MFARINGINNIICRGKMAKNAETDMAVSMYDGIDIEKITQEESGEMVGGANSKGFSSLSRAGTGWNVVSIQ